ncbi:MAG: zinc-binding dehydrogenase [Verrucomicrobiota bacterium]
MPVAKASVLTTFNTPLRLAEFALPDALEAGAVLVRTEMAGICGTDVHLWRGELPIQLPVILGHETVGRIVQIGPGLDCDWTGQPLRVGDRITWTSATSCGECFYCVTKRQPTRCPHRRAYGIGYRCDVPPHFLGGYAEFHYLRPRANLFKLPDTLPTEAVIGAGCALITAIHGVERICIENGAGLPGAETASPLVRARMPVLPELWRDVVVVQGAGPVGISALAVAKQAGARKVILIGAPRHRLELARRFGADETLCLDDLPDAAGRIAAVRERTGGFGADAVIECVGHPSVIHEGMEMCRDGGKYLVLGHYCDAGPVSFNPHLITRKQLQVFGSWSSEPRHMKAALDFLAGTESQFPFASMVTHRFGIEQAQEALMTTARWESAKTVLVP